MPITLVGVAEANNPGNDVTLDLTGISLQQNDIVYVAAGAAAQSAISGWTGPDGSPSSNGASWYKIMGATPDTSVVIPDSNAIFGCAVVAMAFRGVDTTTPLDATTTEATGSGSGGPTNPSITTVTNNAAVLAFAGRISGLAEGSITAPSGYGDLVDEQSDASTADATTAMAWITKVTAGTETPGAWSGFIGTGTWWGITAALRPADGGGSAAGITNPIGGKLLKPHTLSGLVG